MKKSTLAISVVAALAAITTGGAWYTGSQVEQRYPELLKQANESLRALSAYGIENAQISDVQFNKGLFSSEVKYVISGNVEGKTYRLTGDDKVFHGPIPLNRLSKGIFAPALLSAESHISPETEALKAFFAQKEAATSTTTVSYSGEADGETTIFAMKSPDGEFETSDIHLSGDYVNSAWLGSRNLSAEKIQYQDKDASVVLSGIRYKADFDKTAPKDYPDLEGVGPYQFSIDNLKFNDKSGNGKGFSLSDITLKGDGKLNKDRLVGDIALSSKIKMVTDNKESDFGTFRTAMDIDFSAAVMNDVMKLQNKQQRGEIISESEEEAVGIALLSSELALKVNDLSLENAKGKYGLTLDLALNSFKPEELAQKNKITEMLGIFKPSKIVLNAPIPAVEETVKQTLLFSELTANEAEAAAAAQSEVANYAAQAKQLGMLSEDGKAFVGNLEIRDDKKMHFNGKEMTENELQTALMIIIFGAGRF